MRKDAVLGFLVVAALTTQGTGLGDSSRPVRQPATPAEVTEERIEDIGRSLKDRVLDLAGEVPAGDYPPASVQAILEQWQSTPECSVPAGVLATAEAREIARFISAEAAEALEPSIAGFMIDGWGNPIEIYLEPIAFPARPRIVLRSPGANGVFEGLVYESGEFAAEDAHDDIVWSFDRFCRRPAESVAREEREPSSSTDADRQARTIVDIRNLGVALQSWITDQWTDEMDYASPAESSGASKAPCSPLERPAGAEASPGDESGEAPAGYRMPPPGERMEPAEVEAILHPSNTFFYIQKVPARDGWGEPIEVHLRRDELFAEQVVVIRSPGRDGVFDADCYTIGPFDPEDSGQDIVWADGFFMRWPEGSAGLSNGDTFPDSTDRGDPGSTAPPPGAPSAGDAADPKGSPSR